MRARRARVVPSLVRASPSIRAIAALVVAMAASQAAAQPLPPLPSLPDGAGMCARRSGYVALFATAPLAAGVGTWATERAPSGLDRGLRGLTAISATTALAAVGSLGYMRCDAERAPRFWLWSLGFAPVVAGLALQGVAGASAPAPYERHPWIALPGLALSVAWFGVVAFTRLGYSDASAASAASEPRVMPQILTLRMGRESARGAGLKIRF